jgi:hypothetical protein
VTEESPQLGFRGSDETLDAEIATAESHIRVRVRRSIAEMRALERELRELKRERARRRKRAEIPAWVGAVEGETSDASQ